MGRVVGKSIEAVGVGLLFGARTLSVITKGLFSIGGKQIDMMDTLKEIAHEKTEPTDAFIEDAHYTVIEQPCEPSIPSNDGGTVGRETELVELALSYSSKAYAERMLPLAEILRVDHQALIMAKAIQKYEKKLESFELKKELNRKTSAMVEICVLFQKYHRSGNEQCRKDAQRLLEELKEREIEQREQCRELKTAS